MNKTTFEKKAIYNFKPGLHLLILWDDDRKVLSTLTENPAQRLHNLSYKKSIQFKQFSFIVNPSEEDLSKYHRPSKPGRKVKPRTEKQFPDFKAYWNERLKTNE